MKNNEGKNITLRDVIEVAAWLSADEMSELVKWLEARIPMQNWYAALNTWADEESRKKNKREVIKGSERIIKEVCYRQEKVRCGNLRCKSCPHGPYWYAYFRVNGKQRSKYIGKELKTLEPSKQK